MLQMTKQKLETISDIDVHLFIEKGMKGGISYISKRHSKINDRESSKKRNLSFIGMQIICVGGEGVIPCHMVDLTG